MLDAAVRFGVSTRSADLQSSPGGGARREPWINRGGRGLSPPSGDRHRVPGRAPSDASSLSGGESSRGLKGNQKIYLCPSSPVSLAVSLDTSVPQKPKKKKSASRACEQTKEKGKNLVRRKCKLNIFFFSSGKKKSTSFFAERNEEQVLQNCAFLKKILPRFLLYAVFGHHSILLALSVGSVRFKFCFFLLKKELAIENVFLATLRSAVSRGQQDKVVVDVHHGHVEGRHLVDAQRLVHGRVELLHLQLPLHPLHSVEGGCFVLLPHQQARLRGSGVR